MAGGMDLVQPMPYTAFQSMIDGFAPKHWLNYHRGHHVTALTDEVLRRTWTSAARSARR